VMPWRLASECRRTTPPVMAAPELTGGQRRSLRAHAGRLAASKQLHYVTVADVDRSAAEVETQLDAVELVRCKFAVSKKQEAKAMANQLAAKTDAAVAEVLGHTALLYRPSGKNLIELH
jgi:RNA-binding protein